MEPTSPFQRNIIISHSVQVFFHHNANIPKYYPSLTSNPSTTAVVFRMYYVIKLTSSWEFAVSWSAVQRLYHFWFGSAPESSNKSINCRFFDLIACISGVISSRLHKFGSAPLRKKFIRMINRIKSLNWRIRYHIKRYKTIMPNYV